MWSVGESNPWPLDCQSNALANWANAPNLCKGMKTSCFISKIDWLFQNIIFLWDNFFYIKENFIFVWEKFGDILVDFSEVVLFENRIKR